MGDARPADLGHAGRLPRAPDIATRWS